LAKIKRKRARGEGAVYSYLTTGGKNVRWRVEPIGGGPGGKAGFRTQAEALAWQRQSHGKVTAPGTVGEWLDRWLELHKGEWKPKTYRPYSFRVRRWLKPKLGNVKLRDLTGYMVKELLAEMHADGAKDAERHKAGAVLRAALNAAVALGVLHANPMTAAGKVRLPSPKHPEKKAFSREQVAALVRAADALGRGHVVRLWLDTGLRPGELLALDWEDFDLQTGRVKVWKNLDSETHTVGTPKTPQSRRTLKLSAPTVASLQVAAGSGVFVKAPRSKGDRWWESRFRDNWWLPLLAAAGLGGRGFTPHCVRHTMATHLLRSGVPVTVVSRRLGHASVAMTLNVYSHVLEGDDDTAADTMGVLLG
jgi:integrase